jgi:bifunctional non-homologous end joining protein LigD
MAVGKETADAYLIRMFKAFEFCLPTTGAKVPAGAEWFHEIKYDGFRLRVERDGDRIRLITRGGYDWTKRFPWIAESALKNRIKQFVLDGEAVILGVDGASDFNALHSGKHNEEVQLCVFDVLAMDGDDLRHLPLSMRKANLARLLARRPDAFSSATSNRVRSGQGYSAKLVSSGLRVWCRSIVTARIMPAGQNTGSRSRTGSIQRSIGCRKLTAAAEDWTDRLWYRECQL